MFGADRSQGGLKTKKSANYFYFEMDEKFEERSATNITRK